MVMNMPFLRAAIIAGAALAVTGCAHDYYGRHGYVGASVGYASPYYGPYYGWYDNYYYPGIGAYVYERSGTRHRWNGAQRRYWEARRPRTRVPENWSGYGRARPRDGQQRHWHRR
jgi:hypothetical protein